MISEYMIVQVDDKYTCINKNNDYSNIIGGVFTSPTAAFYYALKELDQNNNGPFVVEYMKKECDEDGS